LQRVLVDRSEISSTLLDISESIPLPTPSNNSVSSLPRFRIAFIVSGSQGLHLLNPSVHEGIRENLIKPLQDDLPNSHVIIFLCMEFISPGRHGSLDASMFQAMFPGLQVLYFNGDNKYGDFENERERARFCYLQTLAYEIAHSIHFEWFVRLEPSHNFSVPLKLPLRQRHGRKDDRNGEQVAVMYTRLHMARVFKPSPSNILGPLYFSNRNCWEDSNSSSIRTKCFDEIDGGWKDISEQSRYDPWGKEKLASSSLPIRPSGGDSSWNDISEGTISCVVLDHQFAVIHTSMAKAYFKIALKYDNKRNKRTWKGERKDKLRDGGYERSIFITKYIQDANAPSILSSTSRKEFPFRGACTEVEHGLENQFTENLFEYLSKSQIATQINISLFPANIKKLNPFQDG